ncbi:hypothetical protein [Pseudomonas sp. GL-B-16]|uniref:hypothetical protein n=1 Tax=Pseudomonas sp. GL-B-16 TaxID=2832373 RepID=UPI001CC05D33|nr:hypothetical protein [Pseudomonas sp. GL-B-16]
MATEKMREEFEAAYVEEMVRIMGENIRSRAIDNTRFLTPNGDFQDPALRLALWAWKTSREALVIELPARQDAYYYDGLREDPEGEAFYADDVINAIQAVGVKMKP